MKYLIGLGAFLCASLLVSAAWSAPKMDPKVPTPKQVLGFSPGAKPATHAQIVRYMKRLASSSRRVSMEVMGKTHEGRPLLLLTISSEANLKRLASIKAAHKRLGRPVGLTTAKKNALLANTPALAWLGYSIHGDEISGSDAALWVAYQLVANLSPAFRKLRKKLVIRIDPCENPDGRSRYLPMLRSFSNAVPNPDAAGLSHRGVWPWGRGNHYLFDLNRDWFSLVHPSSRARVKKLSGWWPQLMVDAHEMGGDQTFLFSPPRAPFNPHLPFLIRPWWKKFAKDQGAAFDRRGWSYYTREWNEELYPGYGSSWPMYAGSIGILYEQVRTYGRVVRLRSGALLTYRDAIMRQATSSIANLKTLAKHRNNILSDWSKARAKAMGYKGPVQVYLFPPGKDVGRTKHLMKTLHLQGIEVSISTSASRVANARDMWGKTHTSLLLPAGSFMVKSAQPLGPLVRNLLDFHIPVSPAFLRTERAYIERGRGSRMYETTAWSLPMSYGLDAYWSQSAPKGTWKRVDDAVLTSVPGGVGSSPKGKNIFGYVYDGNTDAGALLTAHLLQKNISVRVARDAFRVQGRNFARGAILLRVRHNRSKMPSVLKKLAKRFHVKVLPVLTALAEKGPDLGGNRYQKLVKPTIAVMGGLPMSPTTYGAIWHLLDKRMGIPFAGLDINTFSWTDLKRYNVLILPPAWGGRYGYLGRLGRAGMAKIKQWVKAGGTLIAIGSATDLVTHPKAGMSRVRARSAVLKRYPSVVLGPSATDVAALSQLRAVGVLPKKPKKLRKKKQGKKKSVGAKKAKKAPKKKPKKVHPFATAPVVGPGARPFLRKGAAYYRFPKSFPSLSRWVQPLVNKGGKTRKKLARWADTRLQRFRPQGAFLRSDIDGYHWLTFGVPSRLPVMYKRSRALIAEVSVKIAARLGALKALHLSGLLWPEAAGRLASTAYATQERYGRGQLILFADDPVFRGVSWGTQRLLINAILCGPGLGTYWPSPNGHQHGAHSHHRRIFQR